MMFNKLSFKQHFNSLRARLLISACLVIALLLPSMGVALNNAFEQHIRSNIEAQLKAYFYAVLAVTEIDNGTIVMPEVLLENQFNVINSGLYALVSQVPEQEAFDNTQTANILWSSPSFLGANLGQHLPAPMVGSSLFSEIHINTEAHYIYSFTVRFDTAFDNTSHTSAPITVHIVKDLASLRAQQSSFSQQLWLWLVVLLVVLLLIQMVWLIWTLKPLARFTQELQAVQVGEAEQLVQTYPTELNAVASQLNTLLSTEQRQRKRYRNALSDLAHSLKTPLAAIQSQADLSASSIAQISQINRTITHQLKRAQSAGQHAWHLGVNAQLVCDKLLRTLAKIYPNIHLGYADIPPKNIIFQGDEADLTEILGNLLDNACKAAKNQVSVSLYTQGKYALIRVEDNGKGLSLAQQSVILERGKRADTYAQGHGIGLAIVRDLVDTYEGSITIDDSETLGGARFTLQLPAIEKPQ